MKPLQTGTSLKELFLTCIKYFINLFSIALILLGVFVSIKMNFVGRSLWYDEAALAWSLSLRDISSLTSTPLDLVQAAPVGWLYILKITTVLFKNTDFVLRVPSIIFYALTLLLTYYDGKKVFLLKFPLLPAAFSANLPIVIQYSNIFKPYISDCFFSLLFILLFKEYEDGKVKPVLSGILFSILIWFSNPVCFVIGGYLGFFLLLSLIKKDRGNIFKGIKALLPVLLSFFIYYIYWLSGVDDGMNGFWAAYKFPHGISSLLEPFLRERILISLIVAISFLYLLIRIKKLKALNKVQDSLYPVFSTFFVTAFASFIGFFPVNKRMWLFIYPLIAFIVFKTLEGIKNELLFFVIALAVILLPNGILYYFNDENVYMPGYEVKGEYEYLLKNIKENEKVYVNEAQVPIFMYYNDYDIYHLKGRNNPVMTGKTYLFESSYKEEDLSYILGGGSCYIVMGDTYDEPGAAVLFSEAEKEGKELKRVYDKYETPLFYYDGK